MGGQLSTADGAKEKGVSCRKTPHWQLVHSEDLQFWDTTAHDWGFDKTLDFTSDLSCRLQPWCTGGKHYAQRLPETNLSDFEIDYQEDGESDESEHSSSDGEVHDDAKTDADGPDSARRSRRQSLKAVQMIGCRDHLAVVQVTGKSADRMDFVIVDRMQDTIKGILRKRLVTGKPYLCECYISPDLSHLLIKPNPFYIERNPECFYDNSTKLIGVRDDRCTINAHMFEGQAIRYVLAFDPRFEWSRIAIGNRFSGLNDVVSLCDLRTGQIIVESDRTLPQTTQNLVYSPDGRFLASLVSSPVNLTRTFDFSKVYIYNTDTLAILTSIPCNNMSMLRTLTPGAIFPMFSNSGSHLAVGYGTKTVSESGSRTPCNEVTGVDIYRVPIELCLQDRCRYTIRSLVEKHRVAELPLPEKVKNYLMFQPVFV